jgi:hypothetical protein
MNKNINKKCPVCRPIYGLILISYLPVLYLPPTPFLGLGKRARGSLHLLWCRKPAIRMRPARPVAPGYSRSRGGDPRVLAVWSDSISATFAGGRDLLGLFLYLFCHDFRKNKWSNQNFREMYIWRCTPRWQAPAAPPHGVKSLPPWGTAAGAWFRRRGRAARR